MDLGRLRWAGDRGGRLLVAVVCAVGSFFLSFFCASLRPFSLALWGAGGAGSSAERGGSARRGADARPPVEVSRGGMPRPVHRRADGSGWGLRRTGRRNVECQGL